MEESDPPRKLLRRIEGYNHARAINFACFQNRPFLRSERACGWFVQGLELARSRHPFELWAYVVMPTHVHLLIFPKKGPDGWPTVVGFLTTLKQSVSRRAILWIRKNTPDAMRLLQDQQPDGTEHARFWQRGGGYDRNLWNSKHIWETIDYIHQNPVAEGLCERETEWRWSSANQFSGPGDSGPIPLDHEHLPGRPS